MTIDYVCSTTEKCYVKDHMPDFAFLNGHLPGKIKPTDIDGALERNGFVLFIEWKGKGINLKQGQRLFFENATKYAPRQTAIVIYGDKAKPEFYEVIAGGTNLVSMTQCDLEKIKYLIKSWIESAKLFAFYLWE